MLVLSRRIDEAVRIGDDVEVIVVGIKKGEVQLGISAPRSVDVVRVELDVQEARGS
jgi:carbon storage regulator